MFKRLFWLMVGLGLGFGLAFLLFRSLRRTVERYTPTGVADRFGSSLEAFGRDLRAAVAEGREAMRDRELEIRAELAHPVP
ncbi:MAG: hypothetical protein M5U14_06890 [Acidimicrobiia bacterium]|nr:hypothetical protein [Acidimicrobiia bacterium]